MRVFVTLGDIVLMSLVGGAIWIGVGFLLRRKVASLWNDVFNR